LTDAVDKTFASFRNLREGAFIRRKLPPDVIESIERLADAFACSDTKEREEMVGQVEASFRFIFEGYAFHAAQEAIRRNDPGLVKRGLIALAIENTSRDWRDIIPRLALLYRSACKLNMDASELFYEVAKIACLPFRKLIEGYDGGRIRGFRPIETFRYRETGEGDTFAYEYVPPPGLKITGEGETFASEFIPPNPKLSKMNMRWRRFFRRLKNSFPGLTGSR
jgi:hypothetical protein